MSPLTYWHYLLVSILVLLFIIGAILALRSNAKYSFLTALILVLIVTGIFGWISINQSVYRVEISNLDDHRLYQSEQVVIKGTVKNVGKFPVSNVIGVVKLINNRSNIDKKISQFKQPTAFAELYEGDDPSYKPQNITTEHVIADYLSPGGAKSFTIILDYPPYFNSGTYEVDGKVN